MKIQKKIRGGGGESGGSGWVGSGGVRVDLNKKLKFFCENSIQNRGVGRGSGWGVRVNVNEEVSFL